MGTSKDHKPQQRRSQTRADQALELVKQIADGKWWIVDHPLREKAKAITK